MFLRKRSQQRVLYEGATRGELERACGSLDYRLYII